MYLGGNRITFRSKCKAYSDTNFDQNISILRIIITRSLYYSYISLISLYELKKLLDLHPLKINSFELIKREKKRSIFLNEQVKISSWDVLTSLQASSNTSQRKPIRRQKDEDEKEGAKTNAIVVKAVARSRVCVRSVRGKKLTNATRTRGCETSADIHGSAQGITTAKE